MAPKFNVTENFLIYAQRKWSIYLLLGLLLKRMYWILGRKSGLSLVNKVLLYKTILKPIWTYGYPTGVRLPIQTSKSCKDFRIES